MNNYILTIIGCLVNNFLLKLAALSVSDSLTIVAASFPKVGAKFKSYFAQNSFKLALASIPEKPVPLESVLAVARARSPQSESHAFDTGF